MVAALGHLALGLPIAFAILFGAMVAPTDPVAVIAVFRRLGVPSRLANLIEAESLLNDGTGVALFTIALAATTTTVTLWAGALQFVILAVGGVALGVAIGFVFSRLTARVDDPQVEITFTAIAAYGGYLLGEYVHVSGLLTVVGAGLVLGNYGRPRGMSMKTQTAVSLFWDYVAFVLNSVIFLLIGISVPLTTLLDQGGSFWARRLSYCWRGPRRCTECSAFCGRSAVESTCAGSTSSFGVAYAEPSLSRCSSASPRLVRNLTEFGPWSMAWFSFRSCSKA